MITLVPNDASVCFGVDLAFAFPAVFIRRDGRARADNKTHYYMYLIVNEPPLIWMNQHVTITRSKKRPCCVLSVLCELDYLIQTDSGGSEDTLGFIFAYPCWVLGFPGVSSPHHCHSLSVYIKTLWLFALNHPIRIHCSHHMINSILHKCHVIQVIL